jgi:hypothetical protein
MRLLKERGIETARMGTAGDNLGMLRVAQEVGFTIVAETLWYSKDIT